MLDYLRLESKSQNTDSLNMPWKNWSVFVMLLFCVPCILEFSVVCIKAVRMICMHDSKNFYHHAIIWDNNLKGRAKVARSLGLVWSVKRLDDSYPYEFQVILYKFCIKGNRMIRPYKLSAFHI